jgi:hypothetical protein
MRPVEQRHRAPGNPGASLCLPQQGSRAAGGAAGDAGASGAGARRGTGVHGGCADSGLGQRAWRYRGPGPRRFGRSRSGRGHSGCTAGPVSGSGRTGTCEGDGPCAPRSGRRCWTDSPQSATLRWHLLTRHGAGCGTVSSLSGIRGRCRAHLLRSGWVVAHPRSQAPSHGDGLAHRRWSRAPLRAHARRDPRPLAQSDEFASLAALRASRLANSSCMRAVHLSAVAGKPTPVPNRVLAAG